MTLEPLRQWLPSKGDLPRDILAGLTLGTAQIGVTMAYTMLAGVPPVHGLYATMIGTPVGALTASSQRMAMVTTAALCLTAGSVLTGVPDEQRIDALITLAMLCGCVMLLAGLLRAGALVRFVSRAAMVGFMAGIAVQIILAQLAPFTGFTSSQSNKVAQVVDIITHPAAIDPATLAAGVGTVVLVVVISRTRFDLTAMAVALVVGTGAVALSGASSVALIGDIAPIARSLPSPGLPDIAYVPQMLLPAVSLAIIGLVQAAGLSRSVPNGDGSYGDTSRDFVAHGLANIAGGSFGGAPVGGSVAATAVNVRAGARSRWSPVLAGGVVMAVVLAAAPLVEQVPQAVTAGIVMVAAVGQIQVGTARDIWAADRLAAAVMALTFALVLVVPVHYAVLAGAALSMLKYVYQSSLDVRVVELTIDGAGRCHESVAPRRLASSTVTVLDVYGSLFFAAGPKLKSALPVVGDSDGAVVVLRLRGRAGLHSAVLAILRDYAAELARRGGRLYLAGVGAEVEGQLRRTGLLDTLGDDAVLRVTDEPYLSCRRAQDGARKWLARNRDAGSTSLPVPSSSARTAGSSIRGSRRSSDVTEREQGGSA